jgi:hypothetical protein
MTLFRLNTWWSVESEKAEAAAFCVCNLNDNPDESQEQVLIGSLSGILRLYQPDSESYNQSHLIYETTLVSKILQIEHDKFLGPAIGNIFAVLLPKTLCFIKFKKLEDGMAITRICDIKFNFECFNFIYGIFAKSECN